MSGSTQRRRDKAEDKFVTQHTERRQDKAEAKFVTQHTERRQDKAEAKLVTQHTERRWDKAEAKRSECSRCGRYSADALLARSDLLDQRWRNS